MVYTVVLKNAVKKNLRKLPLNVQQRFEALAICSGMEARQGRIIGRITASLEKINIIVI